MTTAPLPIRRRKPDAPADPVVAFRQAALSLSMASHEYRLRILLFLEGGEKYVGELCDLLGDIAQPNLSHHLALLRHSGMAEERRDGKRTYYRLSDRGRVLLDGIRPLLAEGVPS